MADNPSQHGTAPLIAELFGGAIGFFVEVGVNVGSPVRELEQAGWTGVLVEPQPDVAAFLVTARSAKLFAAACVAPDVAGRPLPLRVESPLAAIDIGAPRSTSPSYVIMVPTRTLDDILREAEAPAPLDLVALDAGGRELDALLGFDFEHWRPRLITIADPIVNLQKHRFLKESGYRLIRRVGGFGWYVPAASDAAGRGRRWDIVREYYLMLPFRMAWHALRRLGRRIAATAE